MSTELQVAPPSKIVPMEEMIQIAFQSAIANGAGLEVVDRILAQQRAMIDYQDKLAFNDALQRIQSKLRVIVKDASIPGKGKFASSKAIDKAIVDYCNEENLNLTFDTEPSNIPDTLNFVCDAVLGPYSKRYSLPLPVDGSGPKGGGVMNKTDATLAAVTKGKRYLKNMIFNLRIEETDDEGPVELKIPRDKVGEWLKGLQEAEDLTSLMKLWGKIYTTTTELGDENAKAILIPAYESRKGELA